MLEDDKNLPFHLARNAGFGTASPGDDLLHPEMNARISHETLTETQYLSFSIPEASIHSNLYLWHHPNLGVVSGGAWVWQGSKRHPVEAELNDFRLFMADDPLKNDLHEYRLINSYGVKVIEPLKRLQASYSDPVRQNSFDLEFTALLPPVMTADNTHFEQAMQVRGELTLRGQRFAVDCFTIRDRSWGKPRQEDPMTLPPLTTVQGVFGEDFAFSSLLFDDTSGQPGYEQFALPADRLIPSGSWVWRDGKLAPIVKARRQVERHPDRFNTEKVLLEITDDLGRDFAIRTNTIVTWPSFGFWPNQMVVHNCVEIECEGRRAHGEIYDIISHDYMQHRAHVIQGGK
ncbi:MAG: hypothetical protein AB7P20_25985 [Rhizobiaceae bacterium]